MTKILCLNNDPRNPFDWGETPEHLAYVYSSYSRFFEHLLDTQQTQLQTKFSTFVFTSKPFSVRVELSTSLPTAISPSHKIEPSIKIHHSLQP